ncbi:hypothetical protein [Thiorhodovibrio frisius]|uniref:Fido domain-containing protein n=1 Tax=Thiorhodovibrio frisius TaxID=631362 RepID=H8Z871_9GAMM|nr:hypothetical protein [Thiorhodovibrio frisius]EIC21020.1 hypothetical protein Thi970DRAFT_04702 [Thiorhodovibrio frisius]WPL22076.1 hypothetical protein Thiofri_02227 [Thiorhodovibrio frisius]
MAKSERLNLPAIETSLRRVQDDFDRINQTLSTPRDPLSDRVLNQLLAGYGEIDRCLAKGIDLFELGQTRELLALNGLVLWGEAEPGSEDARRQRLATEEQFYANGDGGIGELIVCHQSMAGQPVWKRAARVYIQILSQPQLYQEGNHRTGSLVMSYILVRAGKPPFVLSVDNAKAYFEPSTLVKNARKHSLRMLLERPKLAKRFAALVRDSADARHLRH